MCAVILPRSGLGHKHGIVLGNGTGHRMRITRGRPVISVWNRGREAFTIQPGDRIAQLVVLLIVRRRCRWWKNSKRVRAGPVVSATPACADRRRHILGTGPETTMTDKKPFPGTGEAAAPIGRAGAGAARGVVWLERLGTARQHPPP
jgi:hypothetical protein